MPVAVVAQISFSGMVKDLKTGEPLPGSSIYFPELKNGSFADAEGKFYLKNLPKALLSVQVSSVGYQTASARIDLSLDSIRHFLLSVSVTEIHEAVVTEVAHPTDRDRNPSPVAQISPDNILQSVSNNIIDVIASKPGMAQISTGASISKPVIRGLGFNRVLVVHDEVRQEGQQWGEEHGIETDEYAIHRIEILKGPSSLLYGSDALGGVIHFIPSPPPAPGHFKGSFLSNYQTNHGLDGFSGNLAGNLNGLVWDLRGSRKRAHDYKNPYDGPVYNSRFQEHSWNVLAGLNKRWGYSHFRFSSFNTTLGITDGERDSITGSFLVSERLNDSTLSERRMNQTESRLYVPGMPRQQVIHRRFTSQTNWITRKGVLKIIAGYQDNLRKEFGNVLMPETPGLNFLLNTFTGDLRFKMADFQRLGFQGGFSTMYQESKNKGTEYVIPGYYLQDFGGFMLMNKSLQKVEIQFGIRYDSRFVHGKDLMIDSAGKEISQGTAGGINKFSAFSTNFSGLSGSMGFSYLWSEHLVTKLNFSRGYRAPNMAELGSNGEHEGTGRYEAGNQKLKPEFSNQADLGFAYHGEHLHFEAEAFANLISGFIFQEKLLGFHGKDSVLDPLNPVSVYGFAQATALLYGGECLFDFHPHPYDWLHLESSYSLVYGEFLQRPGMNYLPMMPSPRWNAEIKAEQRKSKGVFSKTWISTGLSYIFAQNRFYSAGGTETYSPDYFLIHAGVGTTIRQQGADRLILVFRVSNLLNEPYQEHLSRFKYFPENYSTRRKGILNMGRNLSFKIIVPFEFSGNNH